MSVLYLPQQIKVVEAFPNATDAAGRSSDWVSLKGYAMAYILVTLTQGNAATVLISPLQATAVAGTAAKAIPTTQIWVNLDTAASDTLVRATDAATYTTDAGLKNKHVLFAIDPRQLDVTNGFDCIGFTTGASNAANLTGGVFLLCNAKHEVATLASAIID